MAAPHTRRVLCIVAQRAPQPRQAPCLGPPPHPHAPGRRRHDDLAARPRSRPCTRAGPACPARALTAPGSHHRLGGTTTTATTTTAAAAAVGDAASTRRRPTVRGLECEVYFCPRRKLRQQGLAGPQGRGNLQRPLRRPRVPVPEVKGAVPLKHVPASVSVCVRGWGAGHMGSAHLVSYTDENGAANTKRGKGGAGRGGRRRGQHWGNGARVTGQTPTPRTPPGARQEGTRSQSCPHPR
jgi:hypothetical protein